MNLAGKAGDIINRIVPDIRKTADLVKEIASSSREQSQGAEQIGTAMVQLDNVIQTNASASEEMATMAEELSSQAVQLSETMSFFKLDSRSVNIKEIKNDKQKNENTKRILPNSKESTGTNKNAKNVSVEAIEDGYKEF